MTADSKVERTDDMTADWKAENSVLKPVVSSVDHLVVPKVEQKVFDWVDWTA